MIEIKRIYALIMVLALVLGCAAYVSASETPVIEVETVTAEAGTQVEIAVRMKGNPGITAARLQVSYGAGLELIGVSAGDIEEGAFIGPQTLRSPIYINWVHGLKNMSGDHLFARLTFAVAETAQPGMYPVTVSYDPDDVYGVDTKTYAETNVTFAIVNGGVLIDGVERGCAHSFGTYVSNGDAACDADGTVTAECEKCGMTDTVPDPGSALGHDFTEKIEDGDHLVPGSGINCRYPVEYYYDCARCDTMSRETFFGDSAGSHQLGTELLWENGMHFRKCVISGCDYTGEREACSGTKGRCEVCGHELRDDTPTGESTGAVYEEMAEDKGENGGKLPLIILCSVFFVSLTACIILGILKARKR